MKKKAIYGRISRTKNILQHLLSSWSQLWSYIFPHTQYTHIKYKRTLSPHPPICHCCQRYASHFYTHQGCTSPLQGLLICYRYTQHTKKILYQLKYNHRYALAQELCTYMYPHIDSHPLGTYISNNPNNVAICPVPSHRIRKYITKGYNQSEYIAQHIAAHYQSNYIACFRKKKRTGSQVGHSKTTRRSRLQGVFQLLPDTKHILQECKLVILVDDITTTGSTLVHLARTLKKQYPSLHIRGCVFAKK